MTTEITTAANNVIIVGMLDTMLVRDRNAKRNEGRKIVEVTKKTGRDWGRGGRRENMKFQVRSPYGGMFALPIEIEPDVPSAELLEGAEAETMLAIEGTLQLVQTFDGRFATDARDARGRTDRGRPTRELKLRVSCVRDQALRNAVPRRQCGWKARLPSRRRSHGTPISPPSSWQASSCA